MTLKLEGMGYEIEIKARNIYCGKEKKNKADTMHFLNNLSIALDYAYNARRKKFEEKWGKGSDDLFGYKQTANDIYNFLKEKGLYDKD